jgi:hypothetical protein
VCFESQQLRGDSTLTTVSAHLQTHASSGNPAAIKEKMAMMEHNPRIGEIPLTNSSYTTYMLLPAWVLSS